MYSKKRMLYFHKLSQEKYIKESLEGALPDGVSYQYFKKSPIQRISISTWVFKYSTDYLHHQNYKLNSGKIMSIRYTAMISSKINFVKIQTVVTITSSHSLIAQNI